MQSQTPPHFLLGAQTWLVRAPKWSDCFPGHHLLPVNFKALALRNKAFRNRKRRPNVEQDTTLGEVRSRNSQAWCRNPSLSSVWTPRHRTTSSTKAGGAVPRVQGWAEQWDPSYPLQSCGASLSFLAPCLEHGQSNSGLLKLNKNHRKCL